MGKIEVITVDTAVPMPLSNGQKYPIRMLEIGESFLIPLDKRRSVQSLASMYGKSENKVFVIHKINDTSARVWRKS